MTPAEIDRLSLEELRRFAHHQRDLIEAFRRQNNNQRNRIRDLEQQIETMERQLRRYDAKGRRVWTDDERKVLRSLTKQARVYRSSE